MAAVLALAGAGTPAFSVKAAEVYTVEVVPCYQHPVTGEEEDTGHNPGIGQAMVEAQVQSVGLVEIDDDGQIWLTSRWNMVDTQTNVSFCIQTWGDSEWEPVGYEVVQQIQDEYVVTDFRIPLNTLDDVVRATNYVEPMGREVIFYYFLQNLSEGAGDFQTNIQTANIDTLVESMQQAEQEAGEEEGTEEESAGTTDQGTTNQGTTTTTASAATKTTAATTASKSSSSTAASSDKDQTTRSISAKTAKTSSADDLLASASGIDGEDDAGTETVQTAGQTNPALLAAATAGGAAGGAIIGGGIIAVIVLHVWKKKQESEAVYDAVQTEENREE